MKTVLITGGTGLVGQYLSELLADKGYKVIHLSRRQNLKAKFPAYSWDVDRQYIDKEAITQADYIVHLAGANVADSLWTAKRKQTILDSRTKTTALLVDKLKEFGKKPEAIIAASAIGLYGSQGDKVLVEQEEIGEGFLTEVCKVWEEGTKPFSDMGIRVVTLRIGIVLSTQGGALVPMLPSYKVRTGIYFGNGEQYYSWIHIEDVCRICVESIEDKSREGVYNVVAPNPVTNKVLAESIAEAKGIKALVMPMPAFAVRLGMGEMSDIVLWSQRVKPQRIKETGFEFKFKEVVPALKDLFERKI